MGYTKKGFDNKYLKMNYEISYYEEAKTTRMQTVTLDFYLEKQQQ